MKVRRTALRTLLPALALAVLVASTPAARAQTKKTLYERLGGYNAIAAVTDDFIGRLVADKQLERFFVGHSTD